MGAPRARDLTHRRCRYKAYVDEGERGKNRTKSKVRANLNTVNGVIKRIFGFKKVRYRGLEKNANRLFVTSALANLYRAGLSIIATDGLIHLQRVMTRCIEPKMNKATAEMHRKRRNDARSRPFNIVIGA